MDKKTKKGENHATSQGVSSSELLERKFVTNVIKTIIKSSEENLRKAIERADYSAAVRADSYLCGLQVALSIVENS